MLECIKNQNIKLHLHHRLLNHIASLTSNASGENLWKFLENIYTCGVPIPGNSISISLPNSTAVN